MMKKLQFNLRGMHCSACAASIERSVKKLDGAENVYVNFAAPFLTNNLALTIIVM